jgi:hypothetical protein
LTRRPRSICDGIGPGPCSAYSQAFWRSSRRSGQIGSKPYPVGPRPARRHGRKIHRSRPAGGRHCAAGDGPRRTAALENRVGEIGDPRAVQDLHATENRAAAISAMPSQFCGAGPLPSGTRPCPRTFSAVIANGSFTSSLVAVPPQSVPFGGVPTNNSRGARHAHRGMVNSESLDIIFLIV